MEAPPHPPIEPHYWRHSSCSPYPCFSPFHPNGMLLQKFLGTTLSNHVVPCIAVYLVLLFWRPDWWEGPCRHPYSHDDIILIEIGMGGNPWACSHSATRTSDRAHHTYPTWLLGAPKRRPLQVFLIATGNHKSSQRPVDNYEIPW